MFLIKILHFSHLLQKYKVSLAKIWSDFKFSSYSGFIYGNEPFLFIDKDVYE